MANSIEIKFDKSQLNLKIKNLQKIVDQSMPAIYTEYVKNTPIAPFNGGNARHNTSLKNRNTVEADYPYAFVLDAGRGFRDGQMRGSEQAPEGMTKPTVEFARDLIIKTAKQIGNKK